MFSMIRSRLNLTLALVSSFLVLTLVISGGWVLSYFSGTERTYSQENLSELRDLRRESPGDPALLLRSARHHYRAVRHRLQSSTVPLRDVYPLLKHSLRQYRQLEAEQEWELSRGDFFNQAYLYYKLGQFYSTRAPKMARKYFSRARELGIRAHEKGHRSPELIALLANIHYQVATGPEDYRTALNYYSALPTPIRDPVLLMNKALALGGLGEFERAHDVLDRLSGYTMAEPTRDRLTVTRVRLDLRQANYRRALKRIESIPDNRRSLEVRTLRAECLMGLGKPKKARLELKQILRREGAPHEAEILFNNLRDEIQEIRS